MVHSFAQYNKENQRNHKKMAKKSIDDYFQEHPFLEVLTLATPLLGQYHIIKTTPPVGGIIDKVFATTILTYCQALGYFSAGLPFYSAMNQ